MVEDQEERDSTGRAEQVLGIGVVPSVREERIRYVGLGAVSGGQLGVDGRKVAVVRSPPGGVILPTRRKLEVLSDQFIVLLVSKVGQLVGEHSARLGMERLTLDGRDLVEHLLDGGAIRGRPC